MAVNQGIRFTATAAMGKTKNGQAIQSLSAYSRNGVS